jgi:hypothetical protein
MDPADVARTRQSSDLIREEQSHQRQSCPDPSGSTHPPSFTDKDLAAMRAKFPFLAEFSDGFIRSTKPDCILKMETATLKIRETERKREADDKLASNRASLGSNPVLIGEGLDDRWTNLHKGRFLAGAGCSAAKLWLTARSHIGLNGSPPLGNYDMNAVGLGGFVSAKGWVELANPASTKISLKMFSLKGCSHSAAKNSEGNEENIPDLMEVGELQLALRTLRTAASFVAPWNMSFTALENFLINSKFCREDLQGVDKPAALLSQFIDYVLMENANKWRDCEPFLSSSELKNTWHAFHSARPQSSTQKKKPEPLSTQNSSRSNNKQPFNKFQGNNRAYTPRNLPYIDVCYKWNRNLCTKNPGQCTTSNGRPLRHVCDHRTDPNNLAIFCGLNHKRVDSH